MRIIQERGHCSFLNDRDLSAGSLLLAHPSMEDPHFRRAVILLTAHNQNGSLGIVLNYPRGETLDRYDDALGMTSLAKTALYSGGPVQPKKIILTAWKWAKPDGAFQLYFGINSENAKSLQEISPDFQFRGFLGHGGWSEGQLDKEYEAGAWLAVPLSKVIDAYSGEALWLKLVGQISPAMRLLAEEPNDPSLN